jgi:hypothetical protein
MILFSQTNPILFESGLIIQYNETLETFKRGFHCQKIKNFGFSRKLSLKTYFNNRFILDQKMILVKMANIIAILFTRSAFATGCRGY